MSFINTGKIVLNLDRVRLIRLAAGQDGKDVEVIYERVPGTYAEGCEVFKEDEAESFREIFQDKDLMEPFFC